MNNLSTISLRERVTFDEMIMISAIDQHAKLDFYSASSLKQLLHFELVNI